MNSAHRLPPAEKQQLRLGYMRLTDSAPLVIARELGLFAALDLDVELIREVSWANLRDRLVMGDLDGSQLLAPLPMMTSYGAGGIRANIITALSLSLNGNAITLANPLVDRLQMPPTGGLPDLRGAGRRLRTLLAEAPRKPALTFATVHLFSMHTLLLRMWLQASGVDPDSDIRIIVLPPEQMCDSLARGVIDGYCVGEPWNTIAVQQGIGSVIGTGYQIWNNAPEKVLGVTEDWHQSHPATHLRLRVALMQACQWLGDKANSAATAAILSRSHYLNLPERALLPSLSGDFCFSKGAATVALPDFHVFWNYHAGFPWRSHAEWLVRESTRALSRPVTPEQMGSLVQRSYRTDLYREAARYLDLPSPSKDYKEENHHAGGWEFEAGIYLGADCQLLPDGD